MKTWSSEILMKNTGFIVLTSLANVFLRRNEVSKYHMALRMNKSI